MDNKRVRRVNITYKIYTRQNYVKSNLHIKSFFKVRPRNDQNQERKNMKNVKFLLQLYTNYLLEQKENEKKLKNEKKNVENKFKKTNRPEKIRKAKPLILINTNKEIIYAVCLNTNKER